MLLDNASRLDSSSWVRLLRRIQKSTHTITLGDWKLGTGRLKRMYCFESAADSLSALGARALSGPALGLCLSRAPSKAPPHNIVSRMWCVISGTCTWLSPRAALAAAASASFRFSDTCITCPCPCAACLLLFSCKSKLALCHNYD